jgi:hypothetical protein
MGEWTVGSAAQDIRRGNLRNTRVHVAPELLLFMPIFLTAPLFGLVCGLLLGQYAQ